MDKFSKEQRSKIMSSIRGKDTKEEILLAKTLWKLGYRYRKNNRKVKGSPDLTFKKLKIAIFVDGEFWHGQNWSERKGKIKTNIEFWHKKIERNIERDKETNEFLISAGWTVLRFWSTEVRKNLNEVVATIEKHIALNTPAQKRIPNYPDRQSTLRIAAEPNSKDISNKENF